MFTKKFWIDAAERAIKTMAQVLLTLGALDPLSQDFSTALTTKLIGALMAGAVSILTSIVSSGFGQRDSASVIDTKGDDGYASRDLVFALGAVALVLFIVVLLRFLIQ